MVTFARDDRELKKQMDERYADNSGDPEYRAYNAGAYDYIDPVSGEKIVGEVTAHHVIPISLLYNENPNKIGRHYQSTVVEMLKEIEQYTGLAYDANAGTNGIYLPNTVDAALLGGAANGNYAVVHGSGHDAYIEFVKARLVEIQSEYQAEINAHPDQRILLLYLNHQAHPSSTNLI